MKNLDFRVSDYITKTKAHVDQKIYVYPKKVFLFKVLFCVIPVESSFYCFASHLDLSRVSKKVCYLPHDNSANRIGVFETGYLLLKQELTN